MKDLSEQISIYEAIRSRKSCRAYLDQDVSLDTIEKILEAARWAPSGMNHQPTQVAVLKGETKNKLSKALVEKFNSGLSSNPDYNYCPKEWSEVYLKRRKACGLALYQSLAISMDDKEARKRHWENNYHFFHAPIGLIVFIEKNMPKGSWIDAGMFIQNILLTAHETLACLLAHKPL